MAKSNRRKRQDRVKADVKRAEQARRRAKAEREQQSAERYRHLLDPLTSPADVAGILAAELPDSLAAAGMMQIRLSSGVPSEEIAQTARLMLASATEPPRIGTLAVAAWAAHVTGDEDAERGYASELLSRADAVDDPDLRLAVIRAASDRGHPGEACELIEPYLRGHPDDELAAGIYAEALVKAHAEAAPGERERAALARFGDRSGSEALRAALDAFLGRTEWGATVRKWADSELSRLAAKHWQAAERDEFDALAVEFALTYPVGDGSPEAGGAATGDGPANDTPLLAFAADPATPGELAARASEWDRHARFGIWQLPEPTAAPGVWCTELVTGLRRYAQFPAPALDGASAAPWPVWLGALVPTDGIWRSTGHGIWLSPVEGDAVAEYVEQSVWRLLEALSGVPSDRLPESGGEVRFGLAEPYCARWETGEEPEPGAGEAVSAVIARFATSLASRVWWKRATSVQLTNTDGEPMILIDATVTVSGDVTERLSARPDFAEEEGGQDGQLVWWGGSAHLLDPAEDEESLVLGRLTPGSDRVRVQVNSQRRLRKFLRILADIGAEPEVAEQVRSEPSVDFAWGPVPDGASPAREWERAWLEQPVAVLDFHSPRYAAEGGMAEKLRLEGLLRQLEYQAGLAAARGERPIDTEWLRTELGLTTPLSERWLWQEQRLSQRVAGLDAAMRPGRLG